MTGRSARRWQVGLRAAALGLGGASALFAPIAAEVRVDRAVRPHTDRWRSRPVAPRGATELGISFRPLQAEAMGLDASSALEALLAYPFQLIRLGAYWNRLEPAPGGFAPAELDRQIDAAERAGKRIILCVGAVKTFGYPECFVPSHHLRRPLREGSLVAQRSHPLLLAGARAFVSRIVERYRSRIVERYRGRRAIVAWQVEHEAVDPLGMEHSWRLSVDFVREEIAAVRATDPTRPILLNGFWPTSLPVLAQQRWRTRDQGDSLSAALQLADIVGVDYYPCHALTSIGAWSLYLDGIRSPWQRRRGAALLARAGEDGRPVIVTEGQAEPWAATIIPPDPQVGGMYSCLPERVIENYNRCMRWGGPTSSLSAYFFWGAEYWSLRQRRGDDRYLRAFGRILEDA